MDTYTSIAIKKDNAENKTSFQQNLATHYSDATKYEIIKVISKTLQGRIVLAIDTSNDQEVVIKEAQKQLVQLGIDRNHNPIAEDFMYERDLLIYFAQKGCDGIIKLIDHWHDDKYYFYVMERCESDLFHHVQQKFQRLYSSYLLYRTQPKWKQILMRTRNEWLQHMTHVMFQLSTTVEWLHAQRYCHLDLSLENVMFYDTKTLKIKLIDFGLTQKFEKGDPYFKRKIGKLQYMAPEIYSNKRYDGTKADVWSLGIMLYVVLAGQLPYEIPTREDDAFKRIIDGDIGGLLSEQKRFNFMTYDALDLIQSMLQYEEERITLDVVIQHPFFNRYHDNDANEDRRSRSRHREKDRTQRSSAHDRHSNVSRSRSR